MDRLADDPRFAVLAGKLALGTVGRSPPGTLADASLAGGKERDALPAWAAARGECIKAESAYGNALYRPPLQAQAIDAENKVMAEAVALYNRDISYGEFNRRRQEIAEEQRAGAAEVSRQLQSQRTAQEQADRQARERDQMQRQVEEAQSQAALARQESLRVQQSAARLAAPAERREGPRIPPPLPNARLRNCYRFGSSVTCTGW
jgi:hypothetical protein